MNLSQNILLTIYKSSIRPNPDYDDILYDKPNNENNEIRTRYKKYNTVNV